MKEFQQSLQNSESEKVKKVLKPVVATQLDDLKTRVYPKRFVYFIIDGQDILQNDEFMFSFLEINERLCKLIP